MVTVIVPVYNISAHLERFFLSMEKQSYKDYKMIVVDDGSEDNSLQVCEKFAEFDDRIRIISIPHSGVIFARNLAVEQVDTEYVVFADGDDYVEPGYLEHLVLAVEKYNADCIISRVQYLSETGVIVGEFASKGELLITKDEFKKTIPMLLEERRLNYLYSKIYKLTALKDVKIPDDVHQGSDTMINFEYLSRINSIALIDDLDYHYIKYNSRSITSYCGEDAFSRLLRINKYIYDCSTCMGILTPELIRVIDLRILQSAIWVIDKIIISDIDDSKKAEQITRILNNVDYVDSYQRQKHNTKAIPFMIIEPQDGFVFLKQLRRIEKRNNFKARVLKKCPNSYLSFYHKIKRLL